MRPLRLEMAGFLSYREPVTIDLSGIRAGVILGPNGAGKSSIVEAITWALYGKGRARGPDDFVNAGSDFCRVAFQFELRGAPYRVERQRDRSRGGKTDLGLWTVVADVTTPIGGEVLAETQAKIEELLGLDYDEWLATSLIGQGKADAFTKLTPADRKRLLFDVLELGQYETWAQQARDGAKEASGRLAALESRIQTIDGQLEGEADAAAELDRARTAREQLAGAMVRLEGELADANRERDGARAAVESVRTGQRELDTLRSSREARLNDAEREKASTAQQLDILIGEIADVGRVLVEAEKKAGHVEDCQHAARELSEDLANARGDYERYRDAATTDTARVARFSDEAEVAKSQASDIDLRIASLTNSREQAVCPTCGQDVSPADLEFLLGQLRKEATAEWDRATDRMQAAKQCLATSKENIAQAEIFARVIDTTEAGIRALEAKAERYSTAAAQAPALSERISELKVRQNTLETALSEASGRAEGLREPDPLEVELQGRIAGLGALEVALATVEGRVSTLRDQLARDRSILESAIAKAARAEATVAELGRAREERERLDAEQMLVGTERDELAVAAEGYGRDGVPALLIELCIPEIEEEANRLLDAATQGRFSVSLSTLKATKTAGVKESLEILVADATSARSLEALSGGERQIVDLSLRFALAELVARRAGRRMQTLIVDEAFTELDVAHRQRAVALIHSLLERFETVLCVTHLQELAEAFPTRILVTKEDGSSRVSIEGAAA